MPPSTPSASRCIRGASRVSASKSSPSSRRSAERRMSKTVRLEVFAEMSARIAGGEPRAEVLAAASADDAQFEASQAFWLGRMSDEARNGRGTLAQRYADLFAAAQKTLSAPKKPERRVWRMMAPAKVAFAIQIRSIDDSDTPMRCRPGPN